MRQHVGKHILLHNEQQILGLDLHIVWPAP